MDIAEGLKENGNLRQFFVYCKGSSWNKVSIIVLDYNYINVEKFEILKLTENLMENK
jgi:hypothetical protein